MISLACDPFLKFHGSAPRRTRFDLSIADARLETGLRECQWPVERAPVFERVTLAMPGTTHAAVYQNPIGPPVCAQVSTGA